LKNLLQKPMDMNKFKVDSIFICIFIFAIIFFSYQEGMSYVTRLLSIPLLILFMVRILILKYKFIIPLEFILVGLWLFYSVVCGIFSVNFDVFFDQFLVCLQVIGIALVLLNLLFWLRNPMLVWSSIFFATLIMSVYILQHPKLYYINGRLAGRLQNANLYALALVLSYVYALNRIIASRSAGIKVFFLASVPFILYLIGESGSRKGIIAVVFFGVLVFVLHYKYIMNKSVVTRISIILMFVALVGASSYYISQSKHINRMESVVSALQSRNISKADGSFKERLKLYEYGWKIAVEHPLLGVGLDNFRVVMARNANASKGVYSHSNMIELLASTGFIGVALYYSIYSSIFLKLIKIKRRYWKSRMDENRELYITTFALLVIYFMYDFAMVTYQGKLSWIILSSIITSTSILSERPRNSYILDVNMRKMNESTSIVEALH